MSLPKCYIINLSGIKFNYFTYLTYFQTLKYNKMCYSYNVSVATFTIGTLLTCVNMYYFSDNPLYFRLNIYWFLIILMQLWEALLWKNYKCTQISKIAMINNLIQPLVLLSILTIPNYIKDHNVNIKYVTLISVIYCGYVFRYLWKDYGCIRSNNGVNLMWWNLPGSTLYVLTTIILMKLLIDEPLASYQTYIIGMSLFLGAFLYNYRNGDLLKFGKICGKVGSIWCWVACFAPLVNYYLFYR
jgi:hypothetical protein